ncbi:MAG: ABC transporter permease [Lachnospiraceae bacterium]|nr:ABC transporter permease [Lachnospiraceae bacterium]
MLRVANKKVIRRLSIRSFLVNHVRNLIAILAIALTALLFTSVFTVVSSLNYSIQMSTMRMVGGSAHGSFKYLSEEQVNVLRKDKLIKSSSANLMLTMVSEESFQKHQTELRYGEPSGAKMWFSDPTTGTMPKDKYDIAMDTKVLELLGVTPKLGAKIPLTYYLGANKITEEFILCGYWDYDEASAASEVWMSKEYVMEQLEANKEAIAAGQYGALEGTWTLDVNFKSSRHIEDNLRKIAEHNGYQIDDPSADNYLDTGVNWAYTSASVDQGETVFTYVGITFMCLLIFLVGYLIIYNIFGISVMKDLHFYGMLKTIGATRHQIKRIIHIQAVLLSLIGIPLGLLGGFLIGGGMTNVILSNMTATTAYTSFSAWVFLGATIFSFLTVWISCNKPGNLAGKVSPIEALRYVEGDNLKAKLKKGHKGAKISRMAVSNVLRNKKKSVLVLLSLSLSIVLFSSVFTFVQGFDMNRYTEKFTLTDFIIGSTNYFGQNGYRSSDDNLTQDFMDTVNEQGLIAESGLVYGYNGENGLLKGCYTMDQLKKYFYDSPYFNEEQYTPDENGLYHCYSYLYGLDPFAIQNVKLIDGTLDPDQWDTKHPIIQLINDDDYGKPKEEQKLYNVGDTITLHYIKEFEYDKELHMIEEESYDKEYEVVATAVIPDVMSYRHYGYMQWGMPTDEFIKDTGTANVMIDLFNVKEGAIGQMEQVLKEYTTSRDSFMDYESRDSFNGQFKSFQNMFLILGGSLALVVGMIGILNFINTTITSINTRKGEFAMMQSIGMTGRQLKKMMILEGIFYTAGSVILSFLFYTMVALGIMPLLEKICWFFTFHYTVIPILIVLPVFLIFGWLIPILTYRNMSKNSIVERLREMN